MAKSREEYGGRNKLKSRRAVKQSKESRFFGVESYEEIIENSYNCCFCRVMESVGRLEGFKKVIGGHVFGELGGNSSLNKF